MRLPLSEPILPLNVEWRLGKNMPFPMNYYPEAIVIKDKVYIGAGSSGIDNNYHTTLIMVYNINGDEWNLLPQYGFYWFGMTSVKNQLVLVGGEVQNALDRTNQLGVWDEEGQTWLHNIPPMPTARSGPTVVTYKDRWMIVAGGNDVHTASHSTVEMLDILTGYWHQASALPIRQYKMSSVVIGNMWYLLGGYPFPSPRTQCIYVCIDEVIHQAVFQKKSPSPWRTLPNTPFSKSAAISLNGALLAVGGSGCSSIHLYKPSSNSWVKAGDLLSVRQSCACTLTPSGEILIVGGDKLLYGGYRHSDSVEIGKL